VLNRIVDAHEKRGALNSTSMRPYRMLECSEQARRVRVINVRAPLVFPGVLVGYPHGNPLATPWQPLGHGPRDHGARAGTLDQQRAMIERVSKEIGALSDLVEENEAKGRVGQVCISALSSARLMYPRGTVRGHSQSAPKVLT
jgi:hypothetical protein